MSEESVYQKALNRERLSRKEAERILESKSKDLYEANQALELLNLNLEKKVEIRTQELKKEKDRAEKLSRVKSEFLSMLSHEIKNPLNAVIGFSELMTLNDLDEETHGYVEKIQHSSTILLGIINDILVYSRADSEKLDISKSTFNLRDELEKIITVFEIKAFERKITLFVNCPNLNINTDKQKLTQILVNLIGNSVKFTEDGAIEINVKIESKDNNDYLVCEIKDSGVGIDALELKELFNPFVQVGDKTKFQEGTGLGLAITKKLIELLGGSIRVESKVGKGSSFIFNIKVCNQL